MPVTLQYGSYSFSPVPDISFSTEIQRSEAGYGIGTVDKIILNGVLYASGGQEININNTVQNKSSIYFLVAQKLSGLQDALRNDYQELLLKCNDTEIYKSPLDRTVVDSFNFENSSDEYWLQIINYTINLSVYNTGFIDYIQDSGYLVSNFTNTYNISTNDENQYYNGSKFKHIGLQYPSYTITREISAQGIHSNNSSALNNAIKCVSGLANNTDMAFSNMLSGMHVYDRSTEISKDPINGSYSLRDTFAAYSGSSGWTDSYTITTTIDNNLLRTVDIAGQVQGLVSYPTDVSLYTKIMDDTFTTSTGSIGYFNNKWAVASGGFFNHVRPNIFDRLLRSNSINTGLYKNVFPPSGKFNWNTGLNPIPLNASIDHDIVQGVISYNYTYNSRPLAMISGAIAESIEMEDNYALRTYSFPDIFYRLPLAQDHGTYSNSKRSVSYSAIFPRPFSPTTMTTALKDKIRDTMEIFNPSGIALRNSNINIGPRYFSWVVENNESFDILGGKYSKKITWEYQKGYI